MALTQTLAQLVANTRKCADVEGTSALTRHPDADLNDYVNRGIAALYRVLTTVIPDQRYLASQSITMVPATSLYALGATFTTLVSVDLSANGVKRWLENFDLNERPYLSDPNASTDGIPVAYRLRAGNVEFLPAPTSAYVATLWFVPTPDQLTAGQTTDTIARLDDFIIWFAAREIAKKERLWDLHDRLTADLASYRGEIETIARNRDMNSPPRVRDDSINDRFGRRNLWNRGRRW